METILNAGISQSHRNFMTLQSHIALIIIRNALYAGLLGPNRRSLRRGLSFRLQGPFRAMALGVASANEGPVIVSKAELGIKRICGNCSAKFYDLFKNPIVCPKCSTVLVPPAVTQAKPRRVLDYPRPAAVVHEEVAEIKDSEETVPEDVKNEKELDEKIDDANLIVLDEQDDGDDVDGILGSDVKKDEGS
jgi:hypothetical protein